MVVMVMVMVVVEIWSCVFVREGIEDNDDDVLSSANISETDAVDSMRPSIACSVAPPRCVALAPPLCKITDVSFQSLVRLLRRVLCSTDELHRALAAAVDAAADRGGCSSSEQFGSEPAGDGRVARGERVGSTAPHAQPTDGGVG